MTLTFNRSVLQNVFLCFAIGTCYFRSQIDRKRSRCWMYRRRAKREIRRYKENVISKSGLAPFDPISYARLERKIGNGNNSDQFAEKNCFRCPWTPECWSRSTFTRSDRWSGKSERNLFWKESNENKNRRRCFEVVAKRLLKKSVMCPACSSGIVNL